MDIERVRVGRTADNNLHECGMSLLDVITLVPRLSSKLPAQVGGLNYAGVSELAYARDLSLAIQRGAMR